MGKLPTAKPKENDLKSWLLAALLACFSLIIGCGGSSGGSPQHHHTPTPTATPTPTPPPGISGVVFGGVGSPISGAQVTVFQAGVGGYGAGAVQLAQTNSGSNGSFNFAPVTCEASGQAQQVYLVATGGTAGGQSSPNAAIAMIAAIGSCANYAHTVMISEATTVATVWALNQFMDVTGQNIGTSTTNQSGLGNAINTITSLNFVDLSTGLAPVTFPNGLTSPTATLYTLADILAACVDSSGAGSTACLNLFTAATPPRGTAPTTTLAAALAIARNPVNNVSALFALVPPSPPFTPVLPNLPVSWVLQVTYASPASNFNSPYAVNIDGPGNVWVVNAGGNSVSELLASTGYTTSMNYSPSDAQLNFPASLAFDTDGNVWVANFVSNTVSELTASSGYSVGFNFAPSGVFSSPFSIGLDAAGNVWVANYTGNTVTELLAGCTTSSCTAMNFTNSNTGSPGAQFSNPVSVTLDSAGDAWVTNISNNSVTEVPAGCSTSSCTAFNFNNSNTTSPGASFDGPVEIVLDSSNDVWAINITGNSASELLAGCTLASCTGLNFNNTNTGSPGTNFNGSNSLVVDPKGNLFATNQTGNSLSELSALEVGSNFGAWDVYHSQLFMAEDASGNLWIANNYDSSISEVVGIATPMLTPDQACLKLGNNSCLP